MRAFLKIGDIVEMKDGSVLTVKSLEYNEFCAVERSGYVKKSEIACIREITEDYGKYYKFEKRPV